MEHGTVDTIVQRIHQRAIVIDGHADLLLPIADGKMSVTERVNLPPADHWQPPAGWHGPAEGGLYQFSPHTAYFQTMGMYDVPRLLEGGVTVEVCAVYIDDANLDRPLHRALEMIYWLHQIDARNPNFSVITDVESINALKRSNKVGGVLGFEGLEPLGSDVKLLDVFYALGLRIASLTHSRRNAFADGTQRGVVTGGLTQLGQAAIRRMNELGIVIDLAHLSQAGCWEVIAQSDAPVVLSHTSPRRMFPSDPAASPLYPDIVTARAPELMQAIAATGGVIGIIAYDQPDVDGMLDDLEYAMQAVGPDHVGIGTDFFGIERAPRGFEGIHELPNVTRRMVERGYSEEVIAKLLGGNLLRVFEQIWHKPSSREHNHASWHIPQ